MKWDSRLFFKYSVPPLALIVRYCGIPVFTNEAAFSYNLTGNSNSTAETTKTFVKLQNKKTVGGVIPRRSIQWLRDLIMGPGSFHLSAWGLCPQPAPQLVTRWPREFQQPHPCSTTSRSRTEIMSFVLPSKCEEIFPRGFPATSSYSVDPNYITCSGLNQPLARPGVRMVFKWLKKKSKED